jgi:hypothetical protein
LTRTKGASRANYGSADCRDAHVCRSDCRRSPDSAAKLLRQTSPPRRCARGASKVINSAGMMRIVFAPLVSIVQLEVQLQHWFQARFLCTRLAP